MQAVILAAGKGTRLQPITLTRSKAMAPLAGKPMVERVMETLVQNGIRDFIMIVSPEDPEIRQHFTERTTLDIEIEFVLQPQRLGMANALSLAAPLIKDSFILSACDNLTSAEHVNKLLDTHCRSRAHATLTLMEVEEERIPRTGIVDLQNGRIRRIVEKPTREEAPSNIGSLPLYAFSRRILEYLPEVPLSPRGEYELQDAIQLLIERDGAQEGGVIGVFTPFRLEVTNARDLLALNLHYLTTTKGASDSRPKEMGETVRWIEPVQVEEDVAIGDGCTIGPNVYLERGCCIGAGATVRNSVVLRNGFVEAGQTVENRVVT